MRNELTTPPSPDDWKRQPIPDARAHSKLLSIVDPVVGPVVALQTDSLPDFEANEIVQATARIQDTSQFADGYGPHPPVTAGTALTERQAQITALGEAVERYCLASYDVSSCRAGTAKDLLEPILSPVDLTPLSDTQLAERGETKASIESRERLWTAGIELGSGERILVPAIEVYSPYDPTPALHSTTTGAAAGTDYVSATIRAFCERVEREAIAVGYYNDLAFPAVRRETLDEQTQNLLEACRDRGQAFVLDATLDGPFPVALAVVVRDSGTTLALGAKCHPDADIAARGALLEAVQTYPFVRYHADTPVGATVTTSRERAALWSDFERYASLRHWTEPSNFTEFRAPSRHTESNLGIVRSFVDEVAGTTALVDVTTDSLAEHGLRVVKLVSTGFVPLPMDERYRPFGRDRLSSLPVSTNYRDRPSDRGSFATVPHPFV